MSRAPSGKWLTWKRGDPDAKKKAVKDEHRRTDLAPKLRALIKHFGPPEAVKIRRRQ